MTALGVLPLALGSDKPGREIEGPLAIISWMASLIGDIQDMAADHESGMLAAAADYHTAVERRERSIASAAGSVAALDQDQ